MGDSGQDDGRTGGDEDEGVIGQPVVIYRPFGAVAELLLNAPPRNLMRPALRAALIAALDRALADPQITGIVLRSTGATFSFGTDLEEAGHEATPTMAILCQRIESATKPVVALIDGSALGAGLELAMAAHYRLATPTARFGLPGILVGLAPDAGASQRLPRLVGVTDALSLLLSGTSIEAARAKDLGLVDGVVPEGRAGERAGDEGAALARDLAARAPVRPTLGREIPVAPQTNGGSNLRLIAQARAGVSRNSAADVAAIDRAALAVIGCVEAALLLPQDQALAFEAATAAELAARPETQGLKHAYRAMVRATTLPPQLARLSHPLPETVAIWGAGPDALTLAAQAMARRMSVTLIDPRPEVLMAGLRRLEDSDEAEVAVGRLSPGEFDARQSRLQARSDAGPLSPGSLLLVAEGAPPAPEGFLILPLGGLGADLRDQDADPVPPGPAVALSPAQEAGQMAELALGDDYPVALAAAATGLARRLGWRLAVTGTGGAAGGPVARRLRQALAAAVAAEQRAGHDPAVIAAALAGWGSGGLPATGLPQAGPDGPRILARCLLALANEGARMIDEGLARGAMTVDAVAVGSGLFPRHRGGPMYQADRRGLMVVRAALDDLARVEPGIYTPSGLILRLLHDGQDFSATG